jgi:GT2 family glycosyltransferase
MKPKLTSIIMTDKIRNKTEAHMTMMAIDMIGKFTNTDEYELIVVDPEPTEAIRDDFKVLPRFKHLKPSPDPDYASCMNLGAKEATGDYLVFIQNDVFVMEGWLPGLRQYLESGKFDVVFPDQIPRSRKYVLETYALDPFDPRILGGEYVGARDAGLIMMTREIFDKVGGWGEGMSLLAERDMYERLQTVPMRQAQTTKVYIAHIMGATNWEQHSNDYQSYNKRMTKDANKLNHENN